MSRAKKEVTDVKPLLIQAGVAAREGKIDQAVSRCREALRVDPDNPQAHAELAHYLLERGEVDDAFHHIEIAIGSDQLPPNCQLLTDLGRISASRGLLRRASEAFREALRLDPGSHDASSGLISVTEQMN